MNRVATFIALFELLEHSQSIDEFDSVCRRELSADEYHEFLEGVHGCMHMPREEHERMYAEFYK